MNKKVKRFLCLFLSTVVLFSNFCTCAVSAGAQAVYVSTAQNQYKIRLLVFEVQTFDSGNKAFGGDSAEYVNYGAEHIAPNEDWCRIDYKEANGTGDEKSEYITLYDRDGDNRYNVVSAWGSSGGYFPSKNGIVIGGFPTYLYAQYYKTGNSYQGKNGQFKIFLQVATLQNGQWVWSEGTNEEIGDAVFNDSFNSDKQNQYGGGILELLSTTSGDNVNNVALVAQGAVNQNQYPKAQGGEPGAAYENEIAICPNSSKPNFNNTILVENAPKDQYGVSMAAKIELSASIDDVGIEQNGWTTILTKHANLPGGEYNSEPFNSQTVTANITWPQKAEEAKAAQASFLAVDYQSTVILRDQNGTKIDESDYYFGCMPNLPAAKKAFDEQLHYVNVRWDHAAQQVSDATNNTYTLLYDTVAHHYSAYEPIDIAFHYAQCDADSADVHRVKQYHTFKSEVIAPTCTQDGRTRNTCEQCGYYYDTDIVNRLGHDWDTGVVTKPATCLESGEKVYTCRTCGQTKTAYLGMQEHVPELVEVAPLDKQPGGVYFECKACGSVWAAAYNPALSAYTINDETPLESREQALEASDKISAPYFNIFYDAQQQYDYASRAASLKVVDLKLPDYQPLRFTASVLVPEKVQDAVDSGENSIEDIGFVYSQTKYIDSTDSFEIGKDKVYRLSLLQDDGAGSTAAITKHTTAQGTQLTFNMAINVKPENWSEDYCARAYITYRFNGFTYTVYDEAYSSRSVEYLARQALVNEEESAQVKEYCSDVLLDIIAALNQASTR